MKRLITKEEQEHEAALIATSQLTCNNCKHATLTDMPRYIDCIIHKIGFSILSWCTKFNCNE